jgi:cbb3-type cytochrome oxidase maturation protein
MSVILILLVASLSIAIGFLLAFIWSVKNGQYDDDYTPSIRMLFDDSKPKDIKPGYTKTETKIISNGAAKQHTKSIVPGNDNNTSDVISSDAARHSASGIISGNDNNTSDVISSDAARHSASGIVSRNDLPGTRSDKT